MNSVEFSTKAVEDLEGILDFISRDNPNAATRFVAMLKERCKILSQFPEMGETRDELAPSLRVFVVGGHAIYYRPLPPAYAWTAYCMVRATQIFFSGGI